MKKLINLAAILCVAVLLFSIAGCNDQSSASSGSDTPDEVVQVEDVVITVSGEQMTLTDTTTLADYMLSLKSSGLIDYEIKDGMVTSINGTANKNSSYWMLYTSDADNANTAWGTVDYDGNTYGSAILGAESLVVKEGCLYIWSYTTYSY